MIWYPKYTPHKMIFLNIKPFVFSLLVFDYILALFMLKHLFWIKTCVRVLALLSRIMINAIYLRCPNGIYKQDISFTF